ncbi:MAG: hypothetical protein ACK5W9_13410 [Bdellovibrionales bacterium]
MLRILLAYDNFQELTSVELMLKKIGFDVLGITSEFSIAEQLLSFNPQIVIAFGKSTKLSTTGVGKRLRESLRWDGQSILIFYPNTKPQAADILRMRMDVGLESPVEPTRLVQVIAQLAGLDSHQLLDKLIKNLSQDTLEKSAEKSTDSNSLPLKDDTVYVGGVGLPKDDEINQILGTQELGFEATPIQDPLLQELENILVGKPIPQPAPPIEDSKRARVYNEILKNMPPLSAGGIPKIEARSRLRDIVAPLSKEELQNQDDLRREFVKALFKPGT